VIAAALRLDRADDYDADVFTQRHEPRRGFIEFRGAGLDRDGGAQRVAARQRVDERRAFDAEAQGLFDDAVEHRIAGLVVEVADQHRDRIVRGLHRAARGSRQQEPGGAADENDQQRGHRQLRARRRIVHDHFVDVGADCSVRQQPIERRHQRRGGLVALIGVRREQLHDDRVDRLRNLRVDLPWRLRRRGNALEQLRHRVLAVRHAQRSPDEHVVHDQAERVLIRAAIHLLALRLLGRHVFERADHRAGQRLRGALLDGSRDAEVHDQRVAAVRHRILGGLLDHDVLGLQVAVHHALLVRGGEALRDLLRDSDHPIERQRVVFTKNLRKGLAFDKRHRQVLDAVDLAEVVNADDVLVRDLAGQHQLALEARLELLRRGRVRLRRRADHLDRHGDAELVIEGLIHGAHAARAEQLQDRVARRDLLPGLERAIAGAQRRTRRGTFEGRGDVRRADGARFGRPRRRGDGFRAGRRVGPGGQHRRRDRQDGRRARRRPYRVAALRTETSPGWDLTSALGTRRGRGSSVHQLGAGILSPSRAPVNGPGRCRYRRFPDRELPASRPQ